MPSCVNLLDPFGDFVFHVCPVITQGLFGSSGSKGGSAFGDYLAFICSALIFWFAEEARLSMSNFFGFAPPHTNRLSSRQYFKLLLNEVSDIDPFSE